MAVPAGMVSVVVPVSKAPGASGATAREPSRMSEASKSEFDES